MSEPTNPREGAREALKRSHLAARRNDCAAAERWSKIAERLAASAETLGHLPPPPGSAEEQEALQAELLRRLARFVDADREIQIWEAEYEIWKQANTGEPMRPHPCGPAGEEAYMTNILLGPEPG